MAKVNLSYLKTHNGELLEGLMEDTLRGLDISKKEMEKIAKGSARNNLRDNRDIELLIKVLNWSADIINKYVDEMNGLCKGEIKFMGARFLDVPEWQFNQNILETGVNRKKYNVNLKDLVSEKGIFFDKFYVILDSFNNKQDILYPDITDKKHLIYYKKFELCVNYARDTLTEGDEEKSKEEKKDKKYSVSHSSKEKDEEKIPSEKYKKETIFVSQESEIQDESSIQVTSPEDFARKYRLENGAYVAQSSFHNSDLERELILAGIKKDDVLGVKSLIKRNYGLSKLLFSPNSENYSREKIRRFSSVYTMNARREELKHDLYDALGIKLN